MKQQDLKTGLKVLIHPTNKSIRRHPYVAYVTRELVNWESGAKIEWCTHVPFGHFTVINDYLLSRMEANGFLKWYQKVIIFFRLI